MLDYNTWFILTVYGVLCLPIAEGQCNGTVKEIEIGYKGKMIKFPDSGVYERNLSCEWLMTSLVGGRIIFQTRNIQISPGDAYYVYDGKNESGKVVHDRVFTSSSTFSHSLDITNSPNLFLKFTSDDQTHPGKDKGFVVYTISAMDHSNCSEKGTELSATTEPKIITSPSFPLKYQSNTICTWVITANDIGNSIIIDVYFIDIEYDSSKDKCYDKLTIKTGSTHVLCGTENFLPNKTYIGSRDVTVTFSSDDIQNENGFIISFRKQETTTLLTNPTTVPETTSVLASPTTEPDNTSSEFHVSTDRSEDITDDTSSVTYAPTVSQATSKFTTNIWTVTDGKDSSSRKQGHTGASGSDNDNHRELIIGIILTVFVSLMIVIVVTILTRWNRKRRIGRFNEYQLNNKDMVSKKEKNVETELALPEDVIIDDKEVNIIEETEIAFSHEVIAEYTEMKTIEDTEMEIHDEKNTKITEDELKINT